MRPQTSRHSPVRPHAHQYQRFASLQPAVASPSITLIEIRVDLLRSGPRQPADLLRLSPTFHSGGRQKTRSTQGTYPLLRLSYGFYRYAGSTCCGIPAVPKA